MKGVAMFIALATVVTLIVLVALRVVAGKAKSIDFTMPSYNSTFYGLVGGWYLPLIAVVAWYQAGVRGVGWLSAIYICVMAMGWLLGPSTSSEKTG